MKLPIKVAIAAALLVVIPVAAGISWHFMGGPGTFGAGGAETYEVEREDIKPSKPSDLLSDDKLEDKHTEFDPELIESRLFGEPDNYWQVNSSAGVIKLDVPDIRDDASDAVLRLYPDYVSAAKALKADGFEVLPSVNLLGGKAKQFDDGLYAAMDLYMARNHEVGVRDIELCVRQMLTEMMPTGEPYAWLWASLEIGGFVSADEYQRRPAKTDEYIAAFLANKLLSNPVGFYNWNANLQRVFRFLRYLQQPIKSLPIARTLANSLRKNAQAREQYSRMLEFYGHLTNPFINLSLLPLINPVHEGRELSAIAKAEGVRRDVVCFLPSSDSPDTTLFELLYPMGVPATANLMVDLIKAIRDGSIDLTPSPDSGWYEYQLHALETLLLPGKGAESDKLLLTRKYKLRLVEAFKSMVTKTRETHIRQLGAACGGAAGLAPFESLAPRLRLEPNPTYYLRIARSYAFIQNYLMTVVEKLNAQVGWRAEGPREFPLGDELENMRQLFYGLYFVSCDDIGLKPELLEGENAEPIYHRTIAAKWLETWMNDPDFKADMRDAVPVYYNPGQYTRFWCTIGVRPIRLSAEYVKAPSWRPKAKHGEPNQPWEEVPDYQLEQANWIILGDEFIEVQLKGNVTLTRQRLREVCDQHDTKEEISAALVR